MAASDHSTSKFAFKKEQRPSLPLSLDDLTKP